MFLLNLYRNPIYSILSPIHSLRLYNTVYALSSGKGKCGVAVIRVSGSRASQVLTQMVGMTELPPPRTTYLRRIRDPDTQEVLDRGLVVWFPGPASFTGEDSCELQVHGGHAVISAVLAALGKLMDFRPAEAGEFTRRAFYGGKMDLTEVEGLADLLQAETDFQRKQALLQTEGALRKLYEKWRGEIMQYLAYLEAHIDFDETEGFESGMLKKIQKSVCELRKEICHHLTDGRRGERLRSGVRVVIAGKPNVGKSSLLNFLSQRPVAIVSPTAGTTRDVLETTLDIGGYPVLLGDTAGLRSDVVDVVEQEGIRRARIQYDRSEIVLLVIEAFDVITWFKSHEPNLYAYLTQYSNEVGLPDITKTLANTTVDVADTKMPCLLVILNKMDVLSPEDATYLRNTVDACQGNILYLSCTTQVGTVDLITQISSKLEYLCGNPSVNNPLLSQTRHRYHLDACEKQLESFEEEVISGMPDVALAAEHLRSAMFHIGKITGSVSTEQLLDIIFKDFCIGK